MILSPPDDDDEDESDELCKHFKTDGMKTQRNHNNSDFRRFDWTKAMKGLSHFYKGSRKDEIYCGELEYEDRKCAVSEAFTCWEDIQRHYTVTASREDMNQLLLYNVFSKSVK